MIFYWFVHHIEGDNGQDIGHTLILGSSLPFHIFSFGCACPLCVLAKGETLLHRACKRNQVETVFKILALPGTDVNVKGKVFFALPRLYHFCVTVLVHDTQFAVGLQEWLTTEGKSGVKLEYVRLLTAFNLQLKCKGCVSKEQKGFGSSLL